MPHLSNRDADPIPDEVDTPGSGGGPRSGGCCIVHIETRTSFLTTLHRQVRAANLGCRDMTWLALA